MVYTISCTGVKGGGVVGSLVGGHISKQQREQKNALHTENQQSTAKARLNSSTWKAGCLYAGILFLKKNTNKKYIK